MNLHYPIILGVLLSACTPAPPASKAGKTTNPAVTAPNSDTSGVPHSDADGASGRDDQTWFTDRTGGTKYPRLMYSARGNDAMSINLQCREAGRIVVTIVRQYVGDKPKAWQFTLVSGPTRQDLNGVIQRAEDGQVIVEAASASDLDIYKALRTSGRLTLEDGQVRLELNAIDDTERRAINDFFETCGVP